MSEGLPQYRKSSPCYGMSVRIAAGFAAPLIRCARTHAARRRAKGTVTMLKSWFPKIVTAALLAAAFPVLAEGKVPLAAEDHINEQLIAAAAGDILRQTCPSLSARTFVVLLKLSQLESYARSKGYTEPEVKEFLKNRAEKARIIASAQAYLAAAGAVEGDVESFCVAGRGEIDRKTLVGSLLRSSE